MFSALRRNFSKPVPVKIANRAILDKPLGVNLERRRKISAYFFRYFNQTVFHNKLPHDTAVIWNRRLLTTAGRCLQATIGDKRRAFIQLSFKICDTAERVRDTLIHEMCHAATWILDGVQHTDHGECFQYWAKRANQAHPELPPIDSHHSYPIRTKFVYRCMHCNSRVGRHSKSLDVNRTACAQCGGRFKLQQGGNAGSCATDRLTKSASFAKFVKDNIKRVRARNKRLSNKEIMLKLSKQFDKMQRK